MVTDSRFPRDAVFGRLRAVFGHGEMKFTASCFWARGYGAWGYFDSDGNAAKLDTETGGFFVGGDAPLGALAGYGSSHNRTVPT